MSKLTLRVISILIAVFLAFGILNCQRQQCGTHCGTERWEVKTLSDPDSSKVNPTLKEETVSHLRGLPRPTGTLTGRCEGVETTTFKVRASLLWYKNEKDGDLHVVIADLDHADETMIVEIPNVACAGVCASDHVDEFKRARGNVVNLFGGPSLDARGPLRRAGQKITVEVVGVGFFDFDHNQTGRAPNNIELHPVLSINQIHGEAEPPR